MKGDLKFFRVRWWGFYVLFPLCLLFALPIALISIDNFNTGNLVGALVGWVVAAVCLLFLSLDQILIPCAIRSLAARKPSSLLCRASQPSQRAPQLAIPVRLLSIKPPSLAIAM